MDSQAFCAARVDDEPSVGSGGPGAHRPPTPKATLSKATGMSRLRAMLLVGMVQLVDGLAVFLVLTCVSMFTAAQAHTVAQSTRSELAPRDGDVQSLACAADETPHRWQEGDGRTLAELEDPESLKEIDASESQSDDETGLLDASVVFQSPMADIAPPPAPALQRGVHDVEPLDVLVTCGLPRGPPHAVG